MSSQLESEDRQVSGQRKERSGGHDYAMKTESKGRKEE